MNHRLSEPIRTAFSNPLLFTVGCIFALATLAVVRNIAILREPSGPRFPLELAAVLTFYAMVIFLAAKSRARLQDTLGREAIIVGLCGAAVEVTNVAIENFAPAIGSRPAVSISFMLFTFLSWGVAAVWSYHLTASWRASLSSAAGSAGICMIFGTACGLLIELFVRPPDPGIVVLWGEYQRSNWDSPKLFAVANTLDSAFTHLAIAPVVAVVIGTLAITGYRVFSRFQEFRG